MSSFRINLYFISVLLLVSSILINMAQGLTFIVPEEVSSTYQNIFGYETLFSYLINDIILNFEGHSLLTLLSWSISGFIIGIKLKYPYDAFKVSALSIPSLTIIGTIIKNITVFYNGGYTGFLTSLVRDIVMNFYTCLPQLTFFIIGSLLGYILSTEVEEVTIEPEKTG
ncbi:MAG: hypothetical protein ACTSYT_03425 [Candidatus Asgardarchaeia archaeon]